MNESFGELISRQKFLYDLKDAKKLRGIQNFTIHDTVSLHFKYAYEPSIYMCQFYMFGRHCS